MSIHDDPEIMIVVELRKNHLWYLSLNWLPMAHNESIKSWCKTQIKAMNRAAPVEQAKRVGVDWEPLGGKVEEDEDCQETRDLFQEYWMKSVVRQKGIDRKHGDMEYKEVLIANYEPFKQGLNTTLWDDD